MIAQIRIKTCSSKKRVVWRVPRPNYTKNKISDGPKDLVTAKKWSYLLSKGSESTEKFFNRLQIYAWALDHFAVIFFVYGQQYFRSFLL